MSIIQVVKNIVKKIPIAFTQNQKYDKQTKQIIQLVCTENSNCIDIGCHKGEVLNLLLNAAPKGQHFGFEPIPFLFENLKSSFKKSNCHFYDFALSNETGTTTFNYVITNPAYSGIKKRSYDNINEIDEEITVKTELLDNVIDSSLKIDFIKIDVEGGEYNVLAGASNIIKKNKPTIIFEHGLGASEFYETTPEKLFDLLQDFGLQVSSMKRFLNKETSFSKSEFSNQFYKKMNYYFIAYP